MRGLSFPVGNGKKIAIARCFYKPSSVLILDEPFSAIDSFSEKKHHPIAGFGHR